MGRSQRHMLFEQNTTSAGEVHAQGEIAPSVVLQATSPYTPPTEGKSAPPAPVSFGGIENVVVTEGPAGGPLQGSSMMGAIPEASMPPEPPEPEPGELVITSPEEGATVPPVHDIVGTGAAPDAVVDLWYAGQDPGEDPPAATTVADSSGAWGFTGDTPAALGPQTWGVHSGGALATVNITVVEEVPEGVLTGERSFPIGPYTIRMVDDHQDGIAILLNSSEEFEEGNLDIQEGDQVTVEATGNTSINGDYQVLTVDGMTIIVDNTYVLAAPIDSKGRVTVTGEA